VSQEHPTAKHDCQLPAERQWQLLLLGQQVAAIMESMTMRRIHHNNNIKQKK
jgi:hypothetical protein